MKFVFDIILQEQSFSMSGSYLFCVDALRTCFLLIMQ